MITHPQSSVDEAPVCSTSDASLPLLADPFSASANVVLSVVLGHLAIDFHFRTRSLRIQHQ